MAFEAIQTLVQRSIERFPHRVAIECPHGRLTYAELDAMADGVAGRLAARGAGPGSAIPVLADDRREITAALLGILRAGGVFVPLDLTVPPLRLERMLRDVEPAWAVVGSTAGDLADSLLAAAPTAVTVEVGADAAVAPVDVRHVPSPDDPCYIFFTSGSTGRPKGIVGRLKAVDHYIRWETELLGIGPGWRVTQLASPAFDAMLRDVFVPLCTGGTACAPPAEALADPALLGRWIDQERIDLVHCVPSLFRGLARGHWTFGSLRCVALSGERLPTDDVRRWFDRFGERIKLINLYGPSETTMTKTYHVVSPADADRPSIPIGRPMPGAEVVLLDERNRSVPTGAIGEIHLGTPFRSLGYHRLPEATARAFVPDPRTAGHDAVLYRTGDFGRLLPDGVLEFLGRKDHQVKVGGVRVELEEVEAVLREHPAVTGAAVVAAEGDADTDPYLCAFVELADEAGAGPSPGRLPERIRDRLRDHLRARLPAGAVPAVFVPVAELPRTLSGKIDRPALRVPSAAAPPAVGRVAPRTPTEQMLAGLWRRLLPAANLGVRDDFFESGGTSLLAMELLTRVGETFGVEVAVREFLAAPTVEALAAQIESSIMDGDDEPVDDLLDALTDLGATDGRRSSPTRNEA
ncbi:hypothetical protein GCM10029978_055190 [Actinoallomurus acanthiterrae]